MCYDGSMKKRAPRSQKLPEVTIGRTGFARISAIEGIRLTEEMWDDFRAFDLKRLSNAERRKTILRKYGNSR
jgi:hypothetical protein